MLLLTLFLACAIEAIPSAPVTLPPGVDPQVTPQVPAGPTKQLLDEGLVRDRHQAAAAEHLIVIEADDTCSATDTDTDTDTAPGF